MADEEPIPQELIDAERARAAAYAAQAGADEAELKRLRAAEMDAVMLLIRLREEQGLTSKADQNRIRDVAMESGR